jgi:hypothetical protein
MKRPQKLFTALSNTCLGELTVHVLDWSMRTPR